ncbi:aromatic acid exporter family protein [Streptomyces sp. JH002]|uniref:aromatic acid exporter family protein n=1 Tax=Streptomyces sp. JH002 TaxID=2763259 RepID=UPI003D804A29
MRKDGTGPVHAVTVRVAVLRDRARQAVRTPGWEREDLLLQLKTVAAAVAAWSLASWLLAPGVATFAPFTTLLAIQGTVHRSIQQSWRYLAAVTLGVVLAAVFGSAVGRTAWTLAVLLLVALALSRAQPLGAQRLQVPVTALFAFSTGNGEWDYGAGLAAAVLIGIGCGLVAVVVLAPAVHHRDADRSVAYLAGRVGDLAAGVARDLREGGPGEAETRAWWDEAQALRTMARQARATVELGEENVRLNPRRLVSGGLLSLPDHHARVTALERAAYQLESVVRGLDYAAGRDNRAELAGDFLLPFAGLLEDIGRAAHQLGESGSAAPAGEGGPEPDGGPVATGRRRAAELAGSSRRADLRAPGEWPLYGALLTDARRALDDLARAPGPPWT